MSTPFNLRAHPPEEPFLVLFRALYPPLSIPEPMNEYFNKESGKDKRRQLRNTMPAAEVILWSKLKGRQLLGCKFRRQHGIGTFVVDFYSPEIRLAIELDGDSHFRDGARE